VISRRPKAWDRKPTLNLWVTVRLSKVYRL
jgi:hypothetical protein